MKEDKRLRSDLAERSEALLLMGFFAPFVVKEEKGCEATRPSKATQPSKARRSSLEGVTSVHKVSSFWGSSDPG